MRLRSLICASAVATAFVALAGTAEAQALSCGGDYVVQRGDTLQNIANKAYGPGKSWSLIYNPNKNVIGRNPSQIEVGMRIRIPCISGASNRAGATAPAEETAAAPAAAIDQDAAAASLDAALIPNRRKLRLITGSDWRPFTDHTQEQGGMITEVMRTALSRVLQEDEFKIDLIRDWGAHLDPLLTDVAYDFSIAWFKPNCALIDRLGENAQLRCNALDFSDPLFEMITGYYVNANDPNPPKTHQDLIGKKVCRVESFDTFMLEEYDIRPPAIEYVRPLTWKECFDALARQEVDVLYVSTMVADSILGGPEYAGLIVEAPGLAYVTTMHAVTSINNPNRTAQLALVNDGLRMVREDGTWFEIVQRHLVEDFERRQAALN